MEPLSLLVVFGLGTVEIWAAVPAGLALQVHPAVISITAALGAIVGILAVVLTGDRVRTWLLQRYGGARGQSRLGRLWTRYGVVGLGLLAPLLVGAPLGTALGISLGAPTDRLLLWMSLGAVLCSVSLTAAGALGLIGFDSLAR
jgi:hypothetical protein